MLDLLNIHGTPTPAAAVDVLNSLLEAELGSIFRSLEDIAPYLDRAGVELRRPIREMIHSSNRNIAELSALVDSLGGFPALTPLMPEEQYLAYLSYKFLLPKLADAKKLMTRRYQNAIAAVPDAPPQVLETLQRQLAAHQSDCQFLTAHIKP